VVAALEDESDGRGAMRTVGAVRGGLGLTAEPDLEQLAGALVLVPGTPRVGEREAREPWLAAMSSKLADIREDNGALVAKLSLLEQQTLQREEELAAAQLDVHMHEQGR
jgi:hypothetical protein